MDRRYYRCYDSFDTVVPRSEDFPVIDSQTGQNIADVKISENENFLSGIKTDDLVLVGILILLLAEEEKDVTAILGIVFLFLAEYIF